MLDWVSSRPQWTQVKSRHDALYSLANRNLSVSSDT